MLWYKTIHLLMLIFWIGGLMDLTRILGYHVAEDVGVQARLSRMEFRMFWFVSTPGLVVAAAMGIALFLVKGGAVVYFASGTGWFHVKLLCILALIIIHILTGKFIMDLRQHPRVMRPARFKILHGLTGAFVIAILIMVVIKPF